MASRVQSLLSYFLVDLAGSIVRFPVWWYSTGFLSLVNALRFELAYRWKSHAIGLWVKQFFVPMYGSYDLAGRAISVLMRSVVIVGRLLSIVLEVLVYLVIVIAWVSAPIVFLFFFVYGFYRGAFLSQVQQLMP